jgi:hypothetical protein
MDNEGEKTIQKKCVKCHIHPPDTVARCGHLCMCNGCAQLNDECPVCGKKYVKARLRKIYF